MIFTCYSTKSLLFFTWLYFYCYCSIIFH